VRTPACFEDRDTRPIIEGLCRKNNVDLQLLIDLCEVTQKFSGSGRKEGVTNDVAGCIDSFLHREQGRRYLPAAGSGIHQASQSRSRTHYVLG
jgi:hypothetical protein